MRALLFSVAIIASAEAQAEPTPLAVAVPDRSTPVSFAGELAEALDAKCVGCHNAATAQGKLNLETVGGMLKGGKRGPSIVPGNADASMLFTMAAHRVEPVMPPAGKADLEPLSAEELGLLKVWIDGGARDDSVEMPSEPAPVTLGPLPVGVHPIVAVDMTTDRTRIASGFGPLVRVHDVESGLEVAALEGHEDIVQSVRFSRDGRRLAAGGYRVVTLWDAPTSAPAASFVGHAGAVSALAVGPGGSPIVSGGADKSVRVWDAKGVQTRKIDQASPVTALALAPGAVAMAIGGGDGAIRSVGLEAKAEAVAVGRHDGPVLDLAYLADGRLASASADGTARIWPASGTDAPIIMKGHKGPVRAVAAAPDGGTIATGSDDGSIRIWDGSDGRQVRAIDGGGGPVLALAFAADGKTLAIGSTDGAARAFDPATRALLRTYPGHPGPVHSVAFDPTGGRLATATEGGIKVWEAGNARGVAAFAHPASKDGKRTVARVAFGGEGLFVSAGGDGSLRSWTFEGTWAARAPLGPHADRVLALDFNPDGTLLAAGGGEPSRSGEVRLWEVGRGLAVRTYDALHSDTVFGLRFSPDGAYLASASADKFLKVVPISGGGEPRSFEGHTHHVLAVDWKADGKQIVTGGADNVIKVWDFEAGEQLKTLTAAGKQVTAVRWVPGKPIVAGASGDQTVRFWDPDGGKITRTFAGQSDYVFAVAAADDGSRVAAGGADGVLLIWDGADGKTLRRIAPARP